MTLSILPCRIASHWLAATVLGVASLVSPLHADDVITAKRVEPVQVERLLPLVGGVNFRDLGGYATVDGRQVRRGLLYRSGSMTGLTDKDHDYLRQLDIAVIADFPPLAGGGGAGPSARARLRPRVRRGDDSSAGCARCRLGPRGVRVVLSTPAGAVRRSVSRDVR